MTICFPTQRYKKFTVAQIGRNQIKEETIFWKRGVMFNIDLKGDQNYRPNPNPIFSPRLIAG